MKKIILLLSTIVVMFVSLNSYAGYVSGYYKSNGTYVDGYYRSDRNNTVRDNYGYYGNTNPYTGETGSNKYYNNRTSEYYNY